MTKAQVRARERRVAELIEVGEPDAVIIQRLQLSTQKLREIRKRLGLGKNEDANPYLPEGMP